MYVENLEKFTHANAQFNKMQLKQSEKTCSLWFYLKDDATDFNVDITNDDKFKFFRYKAKLL